MAIVKQNKLDKLKTKHPHKKIVYCDGSFDLVHAGHVLFFENCRRFGDILVAGVGSDKDVKRNKGPSRPILSEQIRIKMIDSLKPIDYCFLNKLPNPRVLLSHLDKNFAALKPDIYVVNTDAFDLPFRRKMAKKHKIKMIILKRDPYPLESISTSKIIEKIKALDEKKSS